MARLINNQAIFIHSAKTGGTFFREVLNRFGIKNHEIGSKHSKWDEFVDMGLPMFGFVREPISWYRSRWAYSMLTHFGEQLKYNEDARKHWMAKVWSDDLNLFVENTLKFYPNGIACEYFDRMLNIFGYHKDQVTIHRMEDMEAVVMFYLNNFGEWVTDVETIRSIPRENVAIEDHRFPYQLSRNDFGKFKAGTISPNLQQEIKTVESKIYKLYYNEQI